MIVLVKPMYNSIINDIIVTSKVSVMTNGYHIVSDQCRCLAPGPVSVCIDNCLQTGKTSRYITNLHVNSAFHPSGVGKSNTGLSGQGVGW